MPKKHDLDDNMISILLLSPFIVCLFVLSFFSLLLAYPLLFLLIYILIVGAILILIYVHYYELDMDRVKHDFKHLKRKLKKY